MGYCERKIVLDASMGERVTPEVEVMRREGIKAHAQFHQDSQRMPATQDRRCFVATAAFGADAPETVALRAFRDRTLVKTTLGRTFIKFYYSTSPALCDALSQRNRAMLVVRAVLRQVVRLVGEVR